MERRTLLALALSFLVLGFYPVLLQKFYPNYYKNVSRVHATQAAQKAVVADRTLRSSDELPASKDAVFKNEKLRLVFNEKGGVLRGISFFDFTDSETGAALNLALYKESESSLAFLDFIENKTIQAPENYQVQTNGPEVVLTSEALAGLKVTKKYLFHDDYSADLEVVLENSSDSPIELRYELFAGSTIPPRHSIDNQYLASNFFLNAGGKNILKHIKETRQGRDVSSDGFVQWIAVKDRHFSIILKPKTADAFSGMVHGLGNRRAATSLISPKISIPARGSTKQEFLLYIGPNEIDKLTPLGLDGLINFGKLDSIGKVLVGALELLHKVFQNYGLSIIVLTILINLLLFPLTRVSYMSMKRMQLIQPQMNRLREQHKKNPDKLNKEMLELYRKHKVNPFGGCLPMIIQMPVFIALYVALSKSVILIDSKLLWIKDLSSPDNVPLPFSLPFVGSGVHILPLLMVVAMFFQQKFTQIKMDGQDPALESQQKMMATMMPVIFGFIFYAMPSGLVLYWLTNTLLMTFYQLHLKKITLT